MTAYSIRRKSTAEQGTLYSVPGCFYGFHLMTRIFLHPPKDSGGAWSVRTSAASKDAKVTELMLPNFAASARIYRLPDCSRAVFFTRASL